ncbi:MAG: carboxyl transferase domain-containing protein [Sporichthyaceae bacterium]
MADPHETDPTARLTRLLDGGSVLPLGGGGEDGFRSATGTVHGTPVVAFASDPAVMGGAMGAEGCAVIEEAYELAEREQCPVVGLWHSGGARLTEGAAGLDAVGRVFTAMTRASGRLPQISLVLGAAAGGAAYGPALTDLVVLAPEGRVFVTGPDVVATVTGEYADAALLGGPEPHGRKTGLVHLVAADVQEAFDSTRTLVDLMARQGRMDLGAVREADLAAGLPDSPRRAYDVLPVVRALLDPGTALVLQADFAPNVTTALGRLGGRTVGVLANNPLRLGGCLDWPSAEKAARFVRMCDAFGIPLAVLVDVPGYLPGVGQEWDGVVRRGAKLLHAFAAAVVPRVTVVTRKAYGGAYIAMNSRSLGATKVFAWPGAEIEVMGPVAAVRILHRRRLAAASEAERPALEAELAAEHSRRGGREAAGARGVRDEGSAPARTRGAVAAALAAALTDPPTRATHGNIPL